GSNNPSNVDGAGRQALFATVIDDELYAWGGFNYTDPYTYADGYKLSKTGDDWAWTTLPSLPTPRTGAGLVTVGSSIYAVAGADYDRTKFNTQTDRTETLENYGSRFYTLDTSAVG